MKFTIPCLDFGFQYSLIRNNWSKICGRILGLVWLKFAVAALLSTVVINILIFKKNHMATLIQEIIVKLKCLEYLAVRLKSTFKKGNF